MFSWILLPFTQRNVPTKPTVEELFALAASPTGDTWQCKNLFSYGPPYTSWDISSKQIGHVLFQKKKDSCSGTRSYSNWI